jgi:hypothetical protein
VLYALLAWMTLPGLAVLLMIILGSVLVAEGAYGH